MPVATREASSEIETLGAQLHKALEELWSAWRPVDSGVIHSYGLTSSQCTLLRLLCEGSRKEVPMGILAAGLALTPSGVTRCAGPLVERGLVERAMFPDDRRVCCLKPTPAGHELWQIIAREFAAHYGRLLQRLAAKERMAIIRAIELLVATAEDGAGAHAFGAVPTREEGE
jgi:DNA-binding MarR family transcriptional regulator